MSRKSVKTPLIYALEPRLLFDGDLGADVASAIVYRDGNNDADVQEAPAVAPENQRENPRENVTFEFHSSRTAIVFIDGGVQDPQPLLMQRQMCCRMMRKYTYCKAIATASIKSTKF